MTRTHGERIASLETKFDVVIIDIKEDISHINKKLDKQNGALTTISLEMPELLRRQGEHHAVFHEHSAMIDSLKEAQCPNIKVMPEDNGDRSKRKWDQPKFKYMKYGLIISIAGLIASNIATCAWVAKNISTILDSMPK